LIAAPDPDEPPSSPAFGLDAEPDGERGEATGDGERERSDGEIGYRGTVVRFTPGSGSGVVRSRAGREVPFELQHVVVLGELVASPGRYAIAVGQEVGFDVGWTSRGLRVTKLFPAR